MNAFKAAIGGGQAQIGFWQTLASPISAEICAGAGFDWLLLDGEHAPNDVPTILAQLQAVAAYPVEPVVRLPVGDTVLIKQYLDLGARSLLIPLVESVEQASELARATRYPPDGVRGIGAAIARASRWNRRAGYLDEAAEEICLLVQVETKRGLDALEEIAGVDGVHGVFIGPADLAASMGHRGHPEHPEVQAAIEGAISRTLALGTPVGILLTVEAEVRRALALGASFVAVGVDCTVLARGAEALAKLYRPGALPLDPAKGSRP